MLFKHCSAIINHQCVARAPLVPDLKHSPTWLVRKKSPAQCRAGALLFVLFNSHGWHRCSELGVFKIFPKL